MRFSRLARIAAAAWVLGAAAAQAEDVVVTTPDGTPGVDGLAGGPGTDGGSSTTAAAIAVGSDEAVSAVATGGKGGDGGDGADAQAGPGIGGDGGRGGSAIASATRNGTTADLSAGAAGGAGGDAGNGGRDTFGFPGFGDASGGRGGDGGMASAAVQGTAAGLLVVNARADGGDGGDGFRRNRGGDGGAASVNATAVGAGMADAIQVGVGSAGAFGGDGGDVEGQDAIGGRGGVAQSQSIANASGAQPITGFDFARGGNGGSVVGEVDGSVAGDGGVATASASATGDADVAVSARAEGGHGGVVTGPRRLIGGLNPPEPEPGRTGDGGQASLQVYGESTGGGRVVVTGIAIGGSTLDAALLEEKRAEHPGLARFATGAAADATLVDAVDGRSAGELVLRQTAVGGAASAAGASRAGAATSSLAKSAHATHLELVAQAITAARTSDFEPGASAVGSDGAPAEAHGDANNDAGGIDLMVRAVAGNAALGALQGGDGGSASTSARATTRSDGRDIAIGAPAFPGLYGLPDRRPESVGFGAYGGFGAGGRGLGGFDITSPGDGGAAESISSGEASGDSAVVVYDLAVGGGAGSLAFGPVGGTPGVGGGAASTATARSAGSAGAEAAARAGSGSVFFGDDDLMTRGGDATARATAEGRSSADAVALAVAGGGTHSGVARAFASSSRSPVGAASATALAVLETGRVDPFRDGASASAQAPSGDRGAVETAARWRGEILRPSIDFTGAPLVNGGTAAFVTGDPDREDVDSLLAGRPELGQGFASQVDRIVETRCYAFLAAGYGARFEPDPYVARSEFDLDVPISPFDITLDGFGDGPVICGVGETCGGISQVEILLGLLSALPDGSIDREGSLLFQVFAEGDLLIEESFPDRDEAFAFFDDRLLDLGPLAVGADGTPRLDLDVVLAFQTVGSSSGGFGFEFLVGTAAVPEPATGALVALGLVALAVRRRRARGPGPGVYSAISTSAGSSRRV